MSNCLGPDQELCSVCADMSPNRLQILSVDDKRLLCHW